MLIDYSLFFNEVELLELRYHVLKDHVDKFVVCEGNKTFSGNSKPFILKNAIKELQLPEDKFLVIELNIPEDDALEVTEFDKICQYPGDENDVDSILAITRDRCTRNALMSVLDQFNDDDCFMINDIDELIDPKYINLALIYANSDPNTIYKFPLINLYGEADLRPYFTNGEPLIWRTALSFVKKSQLVKTTPNDIRANYKVPFNIKNPIINGKIFDEFGWHFSWMGGSERVHLKSVSYGHAPNKAHIEQRNRGFRFKENQSLTWNENTIMKRVPHEILPKQIFELPRVLKVLLPNYFSDINRNGCP
jgi:hypothetical protein